MRNPKTQVLQVEKCAFSVKLDHIECKCRVNFGNTGFGKIESNFLTIEFINSKMIQN